MKFLVVAFILDAVLAVVIIDYIDVVPIVVTAHILFGCGKKKGLFEAPWDYN